MKFTWFSYGTADMVEVCHIVYSKKYDVPLSCTSHMIPFCPEALLSHGHCQPEPRGRVATLCRGPWTKVGQGACRTGRVQPGVLLAFCMAPLQIPVNPTRSCLPNKIPMFVKVLGDMVGSIFLGNLGLSKCDGFTHTGTVECCWVCPGNWDTWLHGAKSCMRPSCENQDNLR